jgi:DNA-binding transcriptional ArsR family regulator
MVDTLNINKVKLAAEMGVHYTTASKHLTQLAEARILKSMKVGRNHFFVNKKLVSILSK